MPRPPRLPRMPGGMPSGPPNRRKKRSIGEPGWNGESSLRPATSSRPRSPIRTLTEITDGFTRSTMSAKPTGCATLRTSLETCAAAGVLNQLPAPLIPRPYAPAPRPATTLAIKAHLRADSTERCEDFSCGDIVGRLVIQNLRNLKWLWCDQRTVWSRKWGLPPYRALARELIFRNLANSDPALSAS